MDFSQATRRTILRSGANLTALAATAPLFAFRGFADRGAPTAEPWPLWSFRDDTATAEPDYAPFNALLAKHLRDPADSPIGLARFDYAAVGESERQDFFAFCDGLAGYEVFTLSGAGQFAYWANLYNALTLKVVLEHWPIDSIRKINLSSGLFAKGPWDAPLAEPVSREGATAVTLNDIEHRILRPLWQDPRAHYAVNCASVGCPNLGLRAWQAADLTFDLDAAAMAFVNSPRGVAITEHGANARVTVSKIYAWFGEDFADESGAIEAGVFAHLLRYAEPELKARLEEIGRLHESTYDWAINSVL